MGRKLYANTLNEGMTEKVCNRNLILAARATAHSKPLTKEEDNKDLILGNCREIAQIHIAQANNWRMTTTTSSTYSHIGKLYHRIDNIYAGIHAQENTRYTNFPIGKTKPCRATQ